jgi:hypothetical protein
MINPDDCDCCTCCSHENCKVIFNPKRRKLVPHQINEIDIGPYYASEDLHYELRDSRKRFKILNKYFYPDANNMIRLFVIASNPITLKVGEPLGTICLAHTEDLLLGKFFFIIPLILILISKYLNLGFFLF